MKTKVPVIAWGVFYQGRDALVLVDGRLPLFWQRNVAKTFNLERMEGKGRVVRVSVHESYGPRP